MDQINDVNHLAEEAKALAGAEVQSPDAENAKPWSKEYYTLPSVRYVTLTRALVFIEAVVCLTLWLVGGNSKYFVDNILHFHLLESTFDLALITTVKTILVFIISAVIESVVMSLLNNPYDDKLKRQKITLYAASLIFMFSTFAYTAIKGALILRAFLDEPDYPGMHPTLYAQVIASVCFSLIGLLVILFGARGMRRLAVIRVLHRLNDEGREVDEEGKLVNEKASITRLIKLAKPEAGLILAATFCLLISSASQTAAPLFFGKVVDAATKSMDELNRTVIILFLIYIAGSIGGALRSWLFTLAGQRFVARLRSKLFATIIQQEVAFFDVTRTGELTNRLASDTQVLQNAVTANVSMLARYLLQIISSIALMFALNASLTGVLLAVVPIVSLGAVQYGQFLKKLRQQFQDRLAEASTVAEESISSIRTVRSFVGEEKATASYSKEVDGSYKIGKKMAVLQGGFEGTIGLLANGAISLVLWYGGKLVYEGHVTPGILTSFLLYTLQVAMAFAFLSSLYGDFMQAVGASVRIFQLLDRIPEVHNDGGTTLDSMAGAIEFKNVNFTYPSRPDTVVLKDVGFRIQPGEMVALVGPSGGGKSTIVSLIERFYDPDRGCIQLGDTNLRDLDPSWFRRHIAMVSQEPTLFACSIKDNIAYGKNATEDEVIEAAKKANAHDFIMGFEDGYDTLVGERGVRLSGGQKQRVAIARALIMDPTVLLLDEATSALDAESEHLVQEAVDRAMENRTVLVIAHRLSTVRNAAQVVVIEKGAIVEKGTHDELLAADGVYKRLVLRQLTAGSFNSALIDLNNSTKEDDITPKDDSDTKKNPADSSANVETPSVNHVDRNSSES